MGERVGLGLHRTAAPGQFNGGLERVVETQRKQDGGLEEGFRCWSGDDQVSGQDLSFA